MKRHVLPPTRGSDTTYTYNALERLTREADPVLTQDLGYVSPIEFEKAQEAQVGVH